MKVFKARSKGFLGLYLLICLMVLYGVSLTSVQAFEPIEQSRVRLSTPNGGESWGLGQTKEIRWNYTGPQATSQRWKLVLIKGQNAVGTIADNVSGDMYNWRVGQYIGGTAALGSDYKIWIVNVATAQLRDASDGFFEIKFVSVGGPLQEKKPSPKLEKKTYVEKDLQMAPDKQKTIQSTLPDLICESITISPSNPLDGDIVGPIVVTIKNIGGSTAPPSRAAFQCINGACFPTKCVGCTNVSEEVSYDPRAWMIRFSVPSIRQGESLQFIFRAVPAHQPGQHPDSPRKWASGVLKFIVMVDSQGIVNEGGAGEANNRKELLITIPGIPHP